MIRPHAEETRNLGPVVGVGGVWLRVWFAGGIGSAGRRRGSFGFRLACIVSCLAAGRGVVAVLWAFFGFRVIVGQRQFEVPQSEWWRLAGAVGLIGRAGVAGREALQALGQVRSRPARRPCRRLNGFGPLRPLLMIMECPALWP